ncbi:MAG TPA: outer membrane lipoprotein carrier protein LolA [Stellaceae bacterium]|jgi:outer membrane lipoprotein-sorting protein|nr:outer membrane lipoprotein carrier protein LolA [Stellaceae bacterium]
MVRIGKGRGSWEIGSAGWWRRALLAVGLALAVLMRLGVACADPPPQPAQLTAQDHADLQRIAAYLNGIGTMTARFHQYSANGGAASGWLWMERPGRMRFQYDPPSPILLLADRFYVYYVDTQLAEVSEVGLKSTPAWFLLRAPISFDDLVVTRFERGDNLLRVTVVDPAAPDNGSLTMEFTDQPLALRQWTIVDQQRHVTTVALSQQQFGMALDPNLFVYQNPYSSRRSNDN